MMNSDKYGFLKMFVFFYRYVLTIFYLQYLDAVGRATHRIPPLYKTCYADSLMWSKSSKVSQLTLRREAQFYDAVGKSGSFWPHEYYGAFCQF